MSTTYTGVQEFPLAVSIHFFYVLHIIMGVTQSNSKVFARKDARGKPFAVPIVLPSDHAHSTTSLTTIDSDHSNQEKKLSSSLTSSEEDALMFQYLQRTYDCGNALGKGSSAQVFEVVDKLTGIKYACKVVHKHKNINDSITMKTEMEIMKRMKHENIINLHELYETSNSQWFILELANNGPLYTSLAGEVEYCEELIAGYFYQVLLGIQYLHSLGIVHRDLKQDNILCSIEEHNGGKRIVPKIIDFGLSAVLDDLPKDSRRMKACRSLQQIWGTREYFAPEVYTQAYGPQIDVWSLGCLLYEMLVGETAFPVREKPVSVVEKYFLNNGKKMKRSFELRQGWSDLSENSKDLIRRMLKRDPRKRISIEECLQHAWFTQQQQDVDTTTTTLYNTTTTTTAPSATVIPTTVTIPITSSYPIERKVLTKAKTAAQKYARVKNAQQKMLVAATAAERVSLATTCA